MQPVKKRCSEKFFKAELWKEKLFGALVIDLQNYYLTCEIVLFVSRIRTQKCHVSPAKNNTFFTEHLPLAAVVISYHCFYFELPISSFTCLRHFQWRFDLWCMNVFHGRKFLPKISSGCEINVPNSQNASIFWRIKLDKNEN